MSCRNRRLRTESDCASSEVSGSHETTSATAKGK